MKKYLISLLAAALCGLCGNAQLLYRISGNGLSKPSYLFGTHHLAPISVIDSVKGTRTALDEAAQIIGEIDMTMNQMELQMKMQPFMMAPADSTLSKVISAEDLARISPRFQDMAPMPGLTLEMLEPMKPFAAQQIAIVGFMSRNMPGYDASQQLDSWFQKEGKQNGKSIKGLETPEFQADLLFNRNSIAKQAKDLVEFLDDPKKSIDEGLKLNEAYLKQDINGMANLSKAFEDDPDFYNKLLKERNDKWLGELPDIMKENPSFIAVGALHLVGNDGLIEQLRKMGYTVEPVK